MNHLQGVPARRAALLLHALPERDREWVLCSLPVDQSIELTDLLHELHEMKVEADPRWIHEVLAADSVAKQSLAVQSPVQVDPILTAPAANPEVPDPLAPLRTLSPQQEAALAGILSHEPLGLVRRLLTLEDWPWTPSVLRALPAARQMQLRQVSREAVRGPSRLGPADLSLLEAIGRRLSHLAVEQVMPANGEETRRAPAAWWKSLPGRPRQWWAKAVRVAG